VISATNPMAAVSSETQDLDEHDIGFGQVIGQLA